ncbi:MAG: CDP-glucose 4,6-dehydratase [Methylococcaceae bacterium]
MEWSLFENAYKGKKVIITGHTGFKGSWLSLILKKMGADVLGYSLTPPTSPSHFDCFNWGGESVIGDIRDLENMSKVFQKFNPDVICHLAAQPIVRQSYVDPLETLNINIMGTANIFEVSRKLKNLKAIISVTSDKCYENKNWVWGYRETDPMGGFDPYSVSKGCAELITSSYRSSFFNISDFGKSHQTLIASARAGNVIGGGDWAQDRLIPDVIRAIQKKEIVEIRNPNASRPWQHVLEPLKGYLMLGVKLLNGETFYADGWNFGPPNSESFSVLKVVQQMQSFWPEINYKITQSELNQHEAHLLKLDCSKAVDSLKWRPCWDFEKTIENTVEWYQHYYNNEVISLKQIEEYFSK